MKIMLMRSNENDHAWTTRNQGMIAERRCVNESRQGKYDGCKFARNGNTGRRRARMLNEATI